MGQLRWLLTSIILLLAGCSANSVSVIDDKAQPRDDVSGRFINLYPGEKDYPLTCEKDCYLPRADVVCDAADRCRYIGTLYSEQFESHFSVKWLGHATFLITTPTNELLITDPVSGEFDWPVNWLHRLVNGRYRPAYPIVDTATFEQLDGVLYSHLHYDHFNKADVKKINSAAQFVVPLGMADHFPSIGGQISELSWHSSTSVGRSHITALPAHHFNSRVYIPYIYDDSNDVSWSGWLIESGGKTLLFAGDTGYSNHFKDIHKQYGDIDICLLPIASYHSVEHPQWYRYVHMTPEDALVAAKDLNCQTLIPWGFGNASWGMGDISSHSPLIRLLNSVEHSDLQADIVILKEMSQ